MGIFCRGKNTYLSEREAIGVYLANQTVELKEIFFGYLS